MTVPFGWVRWSDPGTCARLIPSLNVRLTLTMLPGLCQADNKATLGDMADRDHLLLYLAVDLAILTVRDGLLQALVIERAHGPYQGQLALPPGGGGAPRARPGATRGAGWSAWPTWRSPRTCRSRSPGQTRPPPAGRRSPSSAGRWPSTTTRSWPTRSSGPACGWSTPRWRRRSAAPRSRSATCGRGTRGGGGSR